MTRDDGIRAILAMGSDVRCEHCGQRVQHCASMVPPIATAAGFVADWEGIGKVLDGYAKRQSRAYADLLEEAVGLFGPGMGWQHRVAQALGLNKEVEG